MEMTIRQIIRLALGVAMVTFGIMQQGPGKNNSAWAIIVITGMALLLPAIKLMKKAVFAGSESGVSKNKMLTVRLFYVGSVIGSVFALSYQSELKKNGYIYVGKGYSYSITGETAQQQVNACWIGALASFLIATILHVRARNSSTIQTNITPEPPDFVICAKCLEPLWGKDNPSMICVTCQSNLENLKGFYDRHSELKRDDVPPGPKQSNV